MAANQKTERIILGASEMDRGTAVRGTKGPACAASRPGKPSRRAGLAPVVRSAVIVAPGMVNPPIAAMIMTVPARHARRSR